MTGNKFYQKLIYSKSTIAVILRVLAWVLLMVAVVVGIVESIEYAEPLSLLDYPLMAAAGMLVLYTVAAILNYLAEITDTLKHNADRDTDGH